MPKVAVSKEVDLEIGSRVLHDVKMGTVVGFEGQMALVVFDSSPMDLSRSVALHSNLLNPVAWFCKAPKSDLSKVKPQTKPLIDYFLRKSPFSSGSNKMDVYGLRAMWVWANYHVFSHKLHNVNFVDKMTRPQRKNIASKAPYFYGVFFPKGFMGFSGAGTGGTIFINFKVNLTMNMVWTTLVHEMVHQYNNNVLHIHDGHGPAFLKWKSKIQEICHATLTATGDRADDEIELTDHDIGKTTDEEPEEQISTTRKPYYVLIYLNATVNSWIGIFSESEDVVEQLRDELISRGMRVYLRKMTNAVFKNYLKEAKKGSVTANKKNFMVVKDEIADKIIDDGMPIYASVRKRKKKGE